MSTPHKLTLAPYLQDWDHEARVLSVHLLLTPSADPLSSLVPSEPGVPAFADASFAFSVKLSDEVGALPQRTLVDQTVVLPDPGAGSETLERPDARPIFEAIQEALAIPDSPAADTFSPQARDTAVQVRKYLPRSYRKSFAFVEPRTSLAVTDDSYHCLMRCPPDPQPPAPPMVIGWGEALAFALRQPRLARAMGLIFSLDVPLDPAPRLEDGGWLWVDLAEASDFRAQSASDPGFARSFATRIPPLPTDRTRPIFTPVLFPVAKDAAEAATQGNFDKVFVEAIRFDDGFSKIVHARQPVTADLLDEDGSGASIARDEGVQLGWDDEDILEGQNRVLGAPPDGEDPVVAPRGVFGYRVDVRRQGEADWVSLSKVESEVSLGVDLGRAVEERWSEVVPTEHQGQIWLPAWYLRWRGRSLVVSTPDEQRLMDTPPATMDGDTPVDDDQVELRYGRTYEFRVRMADATGGGPGPEEGVERSGEAPVATLHMRRRRKPGLAEVEKLSLAGDGATPSIRVRRPTLGYPEAVFAAGEDARAELLAQISANDLDPPNAQTPAIRDPDAEFVRIRVLLRLPTYDPAADEDGFVLWYETSRAFPEGSDALLDLPVTWHDAVDYRELDVSAQQGADGSVSGPLPLVKARDVRLEIRALGREDLSYFAGQDSRLGTPERLDLHAVATEAEESDVLAQLPPSDVLRSVFLRPDPVGNRAEVRPIAVQNDPSPSLLARLAAAVDLVADGSLLVAAEGERVTFGCAGLTHHASPDGTSLELMEPSELSGQWIHVLQAVVDRDWTWRGAGSPTLRVIRTVALPEAPGPGPETTTVGSIELMPAINVQAARGPERSYTRLIFLDALPPPSGSDGFPYEVEVTYRLQLTLEGGGELTREVINLLPIVTRPTQVPEVVAAGLALTPYAHDEDYSETEPRIKRLWLEFAEPPADPRDAYFVRPLFRTPDPMLLPGTEPMADPDLVEGTPLDPELVRVITPGQVQDLAGYSSMQRLEPAADSDRRFLVPLPPNTDPSSPELFAFFTYEIRVGHDRGPVEDPLWSTAQGRFGEPLLLEGVQHPAPELPCSVFAEPGGAVRLRAPFATPYGDLKRLLPYPPNTEIWFVLYAQVVQADGAGRRNVQIAQRRARTRLRGSRVPGLREMSGEARWDGAEMEKALDCLGLSVDTPVTALAVELLPEPNATFGDPLGGDLGEVRILRTSPLSPVERDCCAP